MTNPSEEHRNSDKKAKSHCLLEGGPGRGGGSPNEAG